VSPSPTSAPTRARMPLTCARPSAMRRSATRREQAPVSLMNLLRRMRAWGNRTGEAAHSTGAARRGSGQAPSGEQVLVFGVLPDPCRGIAALGFDLPAGGPRVVQRRAHQVAGDAAPADGLRYAGVGDDHRVAGQVVVDLGDVAVDDDGETMLGRVVPDQRGINHG